MILWIIDAWHTSPGERDIKGNKPIICVKVSPEDLIRSWLEYRVGRMKGGLIGDYIKAQGKCQEVSGRLGRLHGGRGEEIEE
jgi:hypothetical protein